MVVQVDTTWLEWIKLEHQVADFISVRNKCNVLESLIWGSEGPSPVLRLKWKLFPHNATFSLSLSLSLALSFSSSVSASLFAVAVPISAVPSLTTNQRNSDIELTWQEIPEADRRGFILGYRVYLITDRQLTLYGTHHIVLVYHCLQQGLFMAVVLGQPSNNLMWLYCLLRWGFNQVFLKLRPSVIG